MKRLQLRVGAAVLLGVISLLGVGVGVLAFGNDGLIVWGEHRSYYGVGAFASAYTQGGNQVSYTKVRVMGYPGSGRMCSDGADSERADAQNYCVGSSDFMNYSHARQQVGTAAVCGQISGESVHYRSGQVSATYASTITHDCTPPPQPEDYCDTSWYMDPGSEQWYCNGSPIVIDTSNNPNDRYKMSTLAQGVYFDLDGDGVLELTAWPKNPQRVRFLALDRNGNGTIDNGTELFGNHTIVGVQDGFAALAAIEANNGDGIIDARDSVYRKLLLWADLNRDGISQPEELTPAYTELQGIGLGYFPTTRDDKTGNQYRFAGWARQLARGEDGLVPRADGQIVDSDPSREFVIYDVWLAYRPQF